MGPSSHSLVISLNGITTTVPVKVDAFALPSRPPSINAPPPPTVSHRISVLLAISRCGSSFDPHHLTLSLRIRIGICSPAL